MDSQPNHEHAEPTQSRPRHRRWVYWPVALISVAALLSYLDWQGWSMLGPMFSRALSQGLGRPVTFSGPFEMHLWRGLRIQAGEVKIAQPDWVKGADASPMVIVRDLRMKVPFATVWQLIRSGGRLGSTGTMGTVDASRLDVVLIRKQDGRASWQFGPAPSQAEQTSTPALPRFDRLVVQEGLVAYVDDALQLQLTARLSTTEGEQAHGGAGLDMRGGGTYLAHPFDVHLSTSGILPVLSQSGDGPPIPVEIEAQAGPSKMRFQGVTHDVLHLGRLEGSLQLSGPSLATIGDLAHVTLPTTGRFALEGVLRKDGQLWQLAMDSLHIGQSQLQGRFSYDRSRSRPLLKGEVFGPQLALVDLAPAFGAAPPEEPTPVVQGRVLPQHEFDVPSLQLMDADIRLNLRKVTLGAMFALPLEPLVADLELKNGVLNVHHLVARTAGGNVAGSLKLDSANRATLKWQAKLRWDKIKLENWLKLPPKPGAKAAPNAKVYVNGELAGQATLTGEGNSTAKLLASLDGNGAMWVQHGGVSHLLVEAISLHIAEALGLLLLGDEQQPMLCSAMRLKARRGLVTPEVAVVDTPASTILISGVISLAKEQLDLTVISHPKNLSLLSLRTPIDITGTFANPHIGLRSSPLDIKLVSAIAMGALAPLASLIPLVDQGHPRDGGCSQVLNGLPINRAKP